MSEQSMQKWENKNITDRRSQFFKERYWEIVYGTEKFYLTDEEKEYLLKSVQRGAKLIELKDMVLTDRFLYIAPNYELIRGERTPDIWGINHNNYPEITDEQRKNNLNEIKEIKQKIFEK